MEAKFNIDFFEILFLSQVCHGQRPIARSMFFDNLSNIHYHKMTDGQRKQMYDVIMKEEFFDREHETNIHFMARFNPDNQYSVSVNYKGKKEEYATYKYNQKYHITKTTSIEEEYITEIKKDTNEKKDNTN